VAAALGVDLLGVYEFYEEVRDPESGVYPQPLAAGPRAARARSGMKEELGLSVSHAKRITLTVTTKYIVSRFKTVTEN
jgi:hypothetical protein